MDALTAESIKRGLEEFQNTPYETPTLSSFAPILAPVLQESVVPTDLRSEAKFYLYLEFFKIINKIKQEQGYNKEDTQQYKNDLYQWLQAIRNIGDTFSDWQRARFIYYLVTEQVHMCHSTNGNKFVVKQLKDTLQGTFAETGVQEYMKDSDLDKGLGVMFRIKTVTGMPTLQQLIHLSDTVDLNSCRQALRNGEYMYIIKPRASAISQCAELKP